MEKKFYILIGKSGSGKGTQAELLKEYLADHGYGDIKHLTTGGAIRDFLALDNSYSGHKIKELVDNGGLLPDFFAVWNWSNIFIKNIKANSTIILDGAPRMLDEAKLIDKATQFYDYDDVTVIYIDVSDRWARDKLLLRGREDDNDKAKMEAKMQWFADSVLEVIDWYKNVNIKRKFYHINGEQSIDKVQEDIRRSIRLYG